MDVLKDLCCEFWTHATESSLRTTLVKNLVVTVGLHDGHVVLLLVSTNLTAYTHTFSQKIHQLVVEFIDLSTQSMQALGRIMLVTNYKKTEDIIEYLWCNLLLSIAPRIIWLAVALYDKAIKAQVHSLLAERSNQVATTTNVARVTDDRQLWYAAMQLDRNLPHREVAVNLLVEARESTMDSTQALDTCLIDALEGTNPQLQVWIDWILHQHWYIHTLQTVSQCLHSKRICRSTSTYPKNIDTILQGEFHMLWSSHLGSNEHARLFLYLFHPRKCLLTITLEASWLGTWLPNTSTEHVATFGSQLLSGSHNLLFCLCRTWTGDDARAFLITWEIQWF